MADNIQDQIAKNLNISDDEGSNAGEGQESTNFKIGDHEYTQEELESLVGLGRMAKEAEEKYSTKIDKVYPEFTKKTQQVKEYEERIAKLEEQFNKASAKAQADPTDDAAIKEARDAARKLGIVLDEDIDQLGYVKASDVPKFVEEYMGRRQTAQKMLDLEKSYNGSDGRPKFDIDEIVGFMGETGIKDPEVAYNVKYLEDLKKWESGKINENKKPGLKTETQRGGNDKPKDVKITRDNIREMVAESLGGN